MPPIVQKKATDQTVRSGQDGTQSPPRLGLVPFARAAKIHTEKGQTFSTPLSANTQLQSHRVPVYGFIRNIHLMVNVAAAGNAAAVAYNADAPWNVLRDVFFRDANGSPILKLSGYELYLANIFGGYRPFRMDGSSFQTQVSGAVATGGSFSFLITIPVAFARDGVGCLPNMDSSQQYAVDITLGTLADVYSVAPTNPPTITTQIVLEAFQNVPASDSAGNANETQPPAMGTVQYWSKQSISWPAGGGEQTILLSRVGNYVRNHILVFRTGAGARSDAVLPADFITEWDSSQLLNESVQARRILNYGLFGYDSPAGVLVYNRTSDPEGLAVGEYGDQYLPSLGSTKLLYRFSPGAAGSVDILTNDVYPNGNLFAAIMGK